MKNKRRILSTLLIICLCLSFFTPLHADGFTTEEKADILNQIGIVRGSSNGYNLDRQLTRSEAVAFIVRLMGKEDYVLLNKDEYDFNNFPDIEIGKWYTPYIGFCKENGIIGGFSDGNFYPDRPISEKAFLKLVLRVLGYQEGYDFTWNNIYQVAYVVGLVTGEEYINKTEDNTNYLRGRVVEVLYNSLTLKKAGTNDKLIELLVDEDAVTLEMAIGLGFIKVDVPTQIQAVSALSEEKVYIAFNEEVDFILPEDITIYETQDPDKTLTVEIVSQSKNELVLKTSKQTMYKNYTVYFSSIEDKDGNLAFSLMGSFEGFRASEIKSDFFRINKAEAVNKSMINVTFTHPVNINAEVPSMYDLYEDGKLVAKGSSEAMSVKSAANPDNVVSISLKSLTLKEDAVYTLSINGSLSSAYGVKLNEGSGDMIKFKGTSIEVTKLQITRVSALDNKTLVVEFNKEVDTFYAQQYLNYLVTGDNGVSIAVNKAVLAQDGDKAGKLVYLTLTGVLDPKKQYELFIKYITDTGSRDILSESKFIFSGQFPAKTDLVITSAAALDKGTIAVYFNKQLDAAAVLNPYYFVITGVTEAGYSTLPAKVQYNVTNGLGWVKLTLPADKTMSNTKNYKIKVVSALADNMGNSSTRDAEFTFRGSSEDTVKPVMTQAMIVGRDTIKVTFSREIAAEAPNLLTTNYTLEYRENNTTLKKLPVSLNYINATTLILKFDNMDFNTAYVLRFESLKDFSGVYTRVAADGNNTISVIMGK